MARAARHAGRARCCSPPAPAPTAPTTRWWRWPRRWPPCRRARMDFPARKAGRRAPDRPPVAIAAVRDEAGRPGRRRPASSPDRLVLGGRSFGGRMCSMAVAEGLPAAGLVLLSYPLHPPGQPDRLRVEHLGALDLPCLFVSGERDPFGSPDEFDRGGRAPSPARSPRCGCPARHDPKGQDDAVAAAVARLAAPTLGCPAADLGWRRLRC